jgi:hypothetical protein
MIFKDVHKRFKKLEMYSILKIFSYVFVIIGFLSTLEIFYILIDSNLRPIGEIFNFILPEIITESRSNSLYPVVVEGNVGLNIIIMLFGMALCFSSLIMFLAYLNCFYKTLRNDYTFKGKWD